MLPAQVIVRIAGNGSNTESGNGGPAINAGTPMPYGVCVSSGGDVFFIASGGVRRVDKVTGIVTQVVSRLNFPYGVCIDKNGHLYVSEYSGHRVSKVDISTGAVTLVAGNGTPGFGGDGSPATQSALNQPQGICTDLKGNLYICDFTNCRIRKVNAATGIITTLAGNGSALYSGDGGQASLAGVPHPVSVCADASDNIYFTESQGGVSCRVRRIDAQTGIVTTVAGNNSYAYSGDGGLATNASLFDPTGVSVDKKGNIYVAEYDDSRVRKIDAATGIITTIAGTGNNGYDGDCIPSVSASLDRPVGIATDEDGNLYIADTYNNLIRKVIPSAGNDATITISANSLDACRGGDITFTAQTTGTGAGSKLQWKKNNQAVSNGGSTYSDVFDPGDVVVCELLNTQTDCSAASTVVSNSLTLTGIANTEPAVTISADETTVCPGSSATFTAINVNNTTDPTFHWLVNGAEVNSSSSTFLYSPPLGASKVSCIITALACHGTWAVISNDITVVSLSSITPAISISTPNASVCEGAPVVFTATATDAGAQPVYQWKINGIDAGDGTSQLSTSALQNGDKVSCELTADASGNCYNPSVVTSNEITISVSPDPGNIRFHILPPNTAICEGEPATFAAEYNLPGDGSFSWQINDSDVASFNSYHPFTTSLLQNGDSVRCVYRSGNACVSEWTSDTVIASLQPSPHITLTPKDTSVASGTQVQLLASVAGNDVSSYTWEPAQKLVSAQTLSPVTVPVTIATLYTLHVTGSNGCEATASVKMKPLYHLHMPLSFSPNGDGVNDVFRIPPPADLTLFVFSIYDRWGELVFTTKDPLKGWDGTYQNHPLDNGAYIYLVKAKNETGNISQTGTVVVLR